VCFLATAGLMLTSCSNTVLQSNETEKPLTLTYWSEDLSEDAGFQTPVAKEISNKTDILLKAHYTTGSAAQAVDMMIAGSSYDDFIYAKGTEYQKLVEAGALIDLTPYIQKYGPNIRKMFGSKLKTMRYSISNPAIYCLSSNAVDGNKLEPSYGFELQHAVVIESNYPRLKTVKDYENVLKNYLAKHKTVEGKKTRGLLLDTDDSRWFVSIANSGCLSTGRPDDGNWVIDPLTGSATFHFLRKEEKLYYKWLNHMFNIGLLDPESFTGTHEQYLAKIETGSVLGLIDSPCGYAKAENRLITDGKPERGYGVYPIQLTTETQNADFEKSEYIGGYGIGISVNCKNPVRAIKFLDWYCTDEAQILVNWGIKGTNYTAENNGRRVISEAEWSRRNNDQDYSKQTGVGLYVYPFPTYGEGVNDATGQPYIPRTRNRIEASYSSAAKIVLSHYNAGLWADLYPQPKAKALRKWGLAYNIPIPSGSDLEHKLAICNADMRSGMLTCIICPETEFDARWDTLMKKIISDGADSIGKQFTDLVHERIKLLSQN
jgi:putative aldouronate transport system substrate-binding protein